MPPRVQAFIGLLIYADIVALLWPVFTGSVDTGVKWAFLVLAALGGLTAVVAWKTRRRWARYALMGMLPGFVIGGIGFAWLVWLGSAGSSDGWEGIVGHRRGHLWRVRRCRCGRRPWRIGWSAARLEDTAHRPPRSNVILADLEDRRRTAIDVHRRTCHVRRLR
jgi:hypothetical protein